MTWTPDRRTVEWVIGVLHEDRIADSLRHVVADRANESGEYRTLVSFDLARQLDERERRDQSGN